MKLEWDEQYPDHYKVVGANQRVSDYIKYYISDTSRFYEDGYWFVHLTKIEEVVLLGVKLFGNVDYRVLPPQIQLLIAQKKKAVRDAGRAAQQNNIDPEDAYGTLYLTASAPMDVVKVVWRHLAKKHHPDQGGDVSLFKRFKEAYEKIRRK